MSADFLDTNVFVYTFDSVDRRKQAIANDLVAVATEQLSGAISHQVVQETLNVLTGKARTRMSTVEIERYLQEILLPLWTIVPHRDTYQRALELRSRYGFAFYDSLILAAAIEAGCDRLLSEDFQHGQQIEGLTIENPFR